MANFPTGVTSFVTRSAGQTIEASHINTLQDEVNAIEQALAVSGTIPGAVTWSGVQTFTAIPVINGATATNARLDVKVGGTTVGIVGASGAIEGDSDTDFGVFAETGKAIKLYVNGSVTPSVTIASDGSITLPTQAGARLTALAAEITPTALSADANNYNPTGLSTAQVLRASATGATRTITGLVPGASGHWLLFVNHGSQSIVLANESASSTATNRFACPGAGDFTVGTGDSVWLYYEHASTRWRVVGI